MHDRPLYPILAHTSTDYLAIANHMFVLASCGYIIGNFYRSIVGDTLNAAMSEDVENGLFLVLAALFVVDALCYYKSMFVSVWPVKRPRRLVEAEAEERRREEAEEADEDDEEAVVAEDEVGGLPWLSARTLSQRVRAVSGASISTTETQEDNDITPGLSPSSSDGWSDTTSTATAAVSRIAGTDQISSLTPYTLHIDHVTSTTVAGVAAAARDDELVVDPTYSALLPLRSSGLGELVNIVASFIALASAILPFFSSYLVAPALPHRRAVDLTPKYQLILDNASMLLWFFDAFIYTYAWKQSLRHHYPGIRESYCQPLHAYFWANLLNVVASSVYVFSVVYGFVLTHSAGEWLDEDREERRHVMRVQRTLALGGDVLYLLCALVMEVAWLIDKFEGEVEDMKRSRRRERRRQRQTQRERQRRKAEQSMAAQLPTPLAGPSTDSFDRALGDVDPVYSHTAEAGLVASELPRLPPYRGGVAIHGQLVC